MRSAPATPDWRAAADPRRRVGHAIEAHGSVPSTNDRAWRALRDGAEDGIAVVADEQTAGRGRRGRRWLSAPGCTIAVSVGVRPRLAAADAWRLSPAAALATLSACAEHASVGLKWPNDVIAADDGSLKVAGLLIETVIDGDRLGGAVIGVGINVNWRRAEMPAEIAGTATSLADLAGRELDPVALLGRLLDQLDAEVTRIEAGRSPVARYRERCLTLGRQVGVETGEGVVSGRATEIDATGRLVVESHGRRTAVSGGEVVSLGPAEVPA